MRQPLPTQDFRCTSHCPTNQCFRRAKVFDAPATAQPRFSMRRHVPRPLAYNKDTIANLQNPCRSKSWCIENLGWTMAGASKSLVGQRLAHRKLCLGSGWLIENRLGRASACWFAAGNNPGRLKLTSCFNGLTCVAMGAGNPRPSLASFSLSYSHLIPPKIALYKGTLEPKASRTARCNMNGLANSSFCPRRPRESALCCARSNGCQGLQTSTALWRRSFCSLRLPSAMVFGLPGMAQHFSFGCPCFWRTKTCTSAEILRCWRQSYSRRLGVSQPASEKLIITNLLFDEWDRIAVGHGLCLLPSAAAHLQGTRSGLACLPGGLVQKGTPYSVVFLVFVGITRFSTVNTTFLEGSCLVQMACQTKDLPLTGSRLPG